MAIHSGLSLDPPPVASSRSLARYRNPFLQKDSRSRLGPCSFWYLDCRGNKVRWDRDEDRIRLFPLPPPLPFLRREEGKVQNINLPIVELSFWQPLFGLHCHVQNSRCCFGCHLVSTECGVDVSCILEIRSLSRFYVFNFYR